MNSSLHIGTWLSIGSPVIAELAGLCGFDWVLFDLEHGNATEATLPDQLRALRGTQTQAIVRVGAPHADLIARVLDWGAHGIMVPHVNSAEEAEAITRAAYYPPRGKRGIARTTRAGGYGLNLAEEVPAPLLMAQIESIEGVNHASEIAQVHGIDVLFVGPADLQFDLKARAASAPGSFDQCLESVVRSAKDADRHVGILIRDVADVLRYRNLGFDYVAVDSDTSILRKAWQETLAQTQG